VYECAHLRISVCALSLTLLVLGVVTWITFIHELGFVRDTTVC